VRRLLGLLALGMAVLMLQGTLATFLPVRLLPDLVFLVVVGAAIAVGGLEGLAAAALLGWAMDLLSGALLGQHALLLALAYAATRVANLQLNLLRALPRVAFVAGLSLAYDGGHAALASLFAGAPAPGWAFVGDALIHALANALCAPAGLLAVQQMAALLSGDEEGGRRSLRVEPRGRVL
jgi:rod shape-determining protein MreD